VKRGFWVALGLGAGATGTVLASRWAKKQAKRVAPATIAREARGGLFDLGKLVSESMAEGKRAMDEREAELRAEFDIRPRGGRPLPPHPPGDVDEPDDPPAA
jgi:hypothetical protein